MAMKTEHRAVWPHLDKYQMKAKTPGVPEQTKRAWPGVLRSLGSLVFLAALLWFVGLGQVTAQLARMSWVSLTLMVGLHLVIILLTAWRFGILARFAGSTITTAAALRLTFPSTLANMLLPTSLAGDAGRIWLVRNYALSLKTAALVGVFDRIIGLASLGAVVLLGALFAPAVLPLWAVGGLCLACLAVIVVLLRFLHLGQTTEGWPKRRLVTGTAALSIAAHMVSVAIAAVFLHTQPEDVPLSMLVLLFPAVLLAASLPISVGGWGVREIAAVTAFGAVGLPTSSAVAMAFVFGVTQTIAAGVGTAVVLASAHSSRGSDA